MSWTDKLTRAATVVTVAGLAVVAGAISFSHMAALALVHGQTGWKSSAFPVSVDGLELVSSLYILAQHRAGRRSGVLPWAALLVGTAASLAANVAVGGHDPVGRALAGWPAISLLVSIKLLFSMFDHAKEDQRTGRDDQRTVPDGPPVPGTDRRTVPAQAGPSRTTTGPGTITPGPAGPDAARAPGSPDGQARPGASGRGGAPVDLREVAHLIPAARAARAVLANNGRRLSPDALADAMRDGYAVSNARASLLLRILKAEENVTTLDPAPAATVGNANANADRPGAAA